MVAYKTSVLFFVNILNKVIFHCFSGLLPCAIHFLPEIMIPQRLLLSLKIYLSIKRFTTPSYTYAKIRGIEKRIQTDHLIFDIKFRMLWDKSNKSMSFQQQESVGLRNL